jgi:signal transduction histidine kinase
MRTRRARWLGCGWVAALFLLATLDASVAQPRRVLLLHSFGPHFAPWNAIAGRFREELIRQSPYPIDLHEASLQGERFEQPQDEGPLADYLHVLFGNRGLDLVITLGAPAARFFQRARPRIFPSTPLLITGADERTFSATALSANDTAVPVDIHLQAMIEDMLRVLPDTATIAMVIGNSRLEKFWVEQLRQAHQPFAHRVALEWFNELSLEEMVKRVGELPPRTAIFYATVRIDARGVPHEDERVLERLRATANAPMFTYIDTNFGHGIVGGPMLSTQQIADRNAAVAVRILNGEPPGSIKTPTLGLATPKYDWRELRRWNIAESALPPGSIVQFRQPTIWQQYRAQLAALFAGLLLQACLISWLLYERRQRHQSESAAHELSARLIHAQEEERSRLARELHDDVTQRLASLAIDAGREERTLPSAGGGAAMQSMREGLVRLSADVHALSYRLHPSVLEDLGLMEALKSECARFSRTCPTRLEVSASEIPDNLPRDTALCLFRIAQEGLRNIARHAGARHAELSLRRRNGGLQLAISDDGGGFDPVRDHDRASLGHASMRQRAFLLGGKVKIDSRPGRGTTILAWVPLQEKHSEQSTHAFD